MPLINILCDDDNWNMTHCTIGVTWYNVLKPLHASHDEAHAKL